MTPIEELTAREMEEGARRTAALGVVGGTGSNAVGVAPGEPGGGPAAVAVFTETPHTAPSLTNPAATPTAPTASEPVEKAAETVLASDLPSFLKRIENEIKAKVGG
jgi:hypothetical protein